MIFLLENKNKKILLDSKSHDEWEKRKLKDDISQTKGEKSDDIKFLRHRVKSSGGIYIITIPLLENNIFQSGCPVKMYCT